MKYVWPTDKDGNKLTFKTAISQIFTNDGRSMQEVVDSVENTVSNMNNSVSSINRELAKKGNMQSIMFTDSSLLTIPTSAWVTNTCTDFDETERADYPYMAEITLSGVLATDSGDAMPSYASQQLGILGNFATGANKFIVEAKEIPSVPITFTYINIIRVLS